MRWFGCILLVFLFGFSIKTNNAMSFESTMIDEPARIRITKSILDNLVNKNYKEVPKDFDAELRQKLTTEKISEMWQKAGSSLGAYKEILNTQTGVKDGQNQVKLRCKFAKTAITLETLFTKDDKVAHFFLYP